MDIFKGKVTLITGASSGIGAQIAVDMGKRGARLALTGRNQENLDRTAQQCRDSGAEQVTMVTGDLTQSEDVSRIMEHVISVMGKIHVLVNNAGGCTLGGLEALDVSAFDNMYQVNVRSAVLVTKLALPYLTETKGSIVNVSSIAGSRPVSYCVAYSMAKASLNQFTQCLALELAPKGVRVNAVNPGLIDTPLFVRPGGHIADTPEKLPEFLAVGATAHPLGRVGTVGEVSDAVCFLASDAASFITGALLPVDGGRHCTVSRPDMKMSGE